MPKTDAKRKQRCSEIVKLVHNNPFVTDVQLSKIFNVSVGTIRLDRIRLGIKETKERIKEKAMNNMKKITSLNQDEIIGSMLEFVPNESATVKYETKPYMTFEKTNVVKGQYIYSLAESIAIALIPMNAALVGVADIKFFEKIYANETIYAFANVKRKTKTGYVVWVRITDQNELIKFKGKYILKGII